MNHLDQPWLRGVTEGPLVPELLTGFHYACGVHGSDTRDNVIITNASVTAAVASTTHRCSTLTKGFSGK